ncbi:MULTISPECIES: hypothetical protein [unclassified Moraxella]|uniref:hypothetical protein n=1 Tax=unclassified Moraxella TaxID=2685852 RepID=UPI003AF5F1CC
MLTTLSTAYRSWAFRVTIWLILAAIAAGLTFMVWVASAIKPTPSSAKKSADNGLVVDPLVLLTNHNPDETHSMVKPIKFDAVIRDMRNYPKEFKDSRFVKANVGKWTVQVMNVAEHEVITDYLNSRTHDRDKFNYFRIVDENNQKRFVLTYGTFGSPQEAIGTSKTLDFGLPNNIQTFPEEFKLYVSQMDEYEITPPLQDVTNNAPREVKLQSTPKLLPAPKAKPSEATKSKPDNPPAPAKTSIEKSDSPNDTLSIQEGRILPERNNNGQDTSNTRSEPKVINKDRLHDSVSEDKSKEVTPKESKPKESKPKETKPKEQMHRNTEENVAPKPKPVPKESTTHNNNDNESSDQ